MLYSLVDCWLRSSGGTTPRPSQAFPFLPSYPGWQVAPWIIQLLRLETWGTSFIPLRHSPAPVSPSWLKAPFPLTPQPSSSFLPHEPMTSNLRTCVHDPPIVYFLTPLYRQQVLPPGSPEHQSPLPGVWNLPPQVGFVSQGPRGRRKPQAPEGKAGGQGEVPEVKRWLPELSVMPEQFQTCEKQRRGAPGAVREAAHLGSWDHPVRLSRIPSKGVSSLHFTSARQSTGEAASEADRLSPAK